MWIPYRPRQIPDAIYDLKMTTYILVITVIECFGSLTYTVYLIHIELAERHLSHIIIIIIVNSMYK